METEIKSIKGDKNTHFVMRELKLRVRKTTFKGSTIVMEYGR